MRKIHREIVSALIFSKDNKLLMGKKDPKLGGVYNDCWHIPGGGVNKQETKIDALIREIKEEVGIDLLAYKVKLVDDKDSGVSEKLVDKNGDGIRIGESIVGAEKVVVEMHFNVYKVVISDKNSSDIEVNLSWDLAESKWFTIPELESIKLTPPSIKLFKKFGYIK